MSQSSELERGYRRLLACYPRAFRRENGDEIIGVLLATAAEDQRRVGLAESVDLLRGALRMRLRPTGQPPQAVRGAIRLMCAGAAGSVALAIAMVVTIGSVKSAVLALDPALTAAQWHGVLVQLAIREWTTPLVIAIWLWLAWANGRGRNWARLAFGAWFIVCGLCELSALAQGVALVAPVIFAVGTVQCFIAAVATVLLFSRRSSLYYQPETAVQ
jgi:hypothetical protein